MAEKQKKQEEEKIDSVTLTRKTESCATVFFHGATVTNWTYKDSEVIFLSKKAIFDNKKAIRGGIPLVFPQFGPWDLGPQHGFARTSMWNCLRESEDPKSGDVSVTFELEDNVDTRSLWNHQFRVEYTVKLKAKSLLLEFSVHNKGTTPFDFTCLLHTYLDVEDISQTKVVGLKGLTYVDKVKGVTAVEENEELSISENIDRVYKDAPDEIQITNTKEARSVTMKKTNFPDIVVWNPWAEKAKQMSDFDDEEYLTMLCVEAGRVSSPFHLQPDSTYFATLEIFSNVPKRKMSRPLLDM